MKSLLSTALAAAIGTIALAPSAFAATTPNTGTINISGTVVSDSCVLAVDGTTNGTVQLPTVTTSQLASSGATAGFKTFTLTLSGCDANATQAVLSFNTGANNDSTTGNLKNATGGTYASGVEVQLLNGSTASSPVINVGSNNNAPTIALNNGSSNASTTLGAQYYATGAAGAGLVSTAATVTFSYN